MANNKRKKYVWAIEWEKFFVETGGETPPRGRILYSITLQPEVKEEDFVKFMVEEAIPTVNRISTRDRFYRTLSLAEDTGKEAEEGGLSRILEVKDMFEKLDCLGKSILLPELDTAPLPASKQALA